MTSAVSSARPSDERRLLLGQATNVPTVSNFFPIERYYTAADSLYTKVVEKAADKGGVLLLPSSHSTETLQTLTPEQIKLRQSYLDEIYTYAKRYCIFYTDSIPSHNYYGTVKYKTIQNKHTSQLANVIPILESIAQCMDHYELYRREEEERLAQERLDQWKRDHEQQKNYNLSNSNINNIAGVEQSALDKLSMLLPPTCTESIQPSPPMYPGKQSSSSTRYRLSISDSDDDNDDADAPPTNGHSSPWSNVVPLPPPMMPPTSTVTPPSYDSITGIGTPQPMVQHPSQTGIAQTGRPLSIRQLQSVYRRQYEEFQERGRIQVLGINTYQGRVSASTNGCTVISALVAAHHMDGNLKKPSSLQRSSLNGSISNEVIQHVIDVQCGPLLRVIRQKLGLGGHALIIPSDVHDHLVDEKILHQEDFAGVAGGNVLDAAHYGEFLKLLASDKSPTSSSNSNSSTGNRASGRAAATFFFREHVISIVRFKDSSSGQMRFDLIDSLPSSTGSSSSQSMMATRTRCTDLESLKVLLLWYTSRKFSDSNCQFIDRNPWDDDMADLDPRVFQGFVWSA